MMIRIRYLLSVLALASLAISCSYVVDKQGISPSRPGVSGVQTNLSYKTVSAQVVGPRCASCHGSSAAIRLDSYESVLANLALVRDAALVRKSMPRGNPLSSEEAQILAAWIDAGAPLDSIAAPPPTPEPAPTPVASPFPNATPAPAPTPASGPGFDLVYQEIFKPKCLSCHGSLSSVNLEGYPAVKDKLPAIINALLVDQSMPLGGELSKTEIDLFVKWVAAGAAEVGPKTETETETGPRPEEKPTEPVIPSVPGPTFTKINESVLQSSCVRCHSGARPAGDVNLTSKDGVLKVVVPGEPDASRLVVAIERRDARRMPPAFTGIVLSEAQIAEIREWVKNGAGD